MTASEKTVTTTPVQYALRYAARGWAVFPCREGEKRPLTERGLHSATTDEAMIQSLWRDNPRANIGVPCGAHFWVLDVDPRHGGDDALAALQDQHGELPKTLFARTPSGGSHYYFAATPEARNSAGKVGLGIDVRGHGGYVCVEGSLVAGGTYSFLDWDPLTAEDPILLPAPQWLLDRAFGKPAAPAKAAGTEAGKQVIEGGRNAFLTSQAGKLRRQGLSAAALEAALQQVNVERCSPPLERSEVSTIAGSVGRYEPAVPDEKVPQRRIIKWRELANRRPPEFAWILEHWLSWHPTLLSGRGGIGKSLLVQQIATGLAIGRPLWGTSTGPVRVLYWACEDDTNEIWRRQDRICQELRVGFDDIDNLFIDARCGLDNTVFATEFSKPGWTALYAELQAQVNDYKADVLVLDNIAQVFGGNENDRHHVTAFLNGIVGLVRDRPFCPIILGHIAKSPTSEFSGSTAWENAARMRWYLADKLPDEGGADPTEPATARRFLCKRKTNYSAQDYVEFAFENGVLAPAAQGEAEHDSSGYLRKAQARRVVQSAVELLAARGIHCSDEPGRNYLVSKVLEFRLSEGLNKQQLVAGMADLIADGILNRAEVGKYANRAPKFGLVLAQNGGRSV